ncbi:MAG TPA: M28 family peptidase [Gemmatimonadota bacterium]|nr:M28 family peptidase [Gemmatimonadota bacterium]
MAPAAVALLLACGGDGKGPVSPAGARFSGELADSLVRRLVSFGPRVPGTDAHAEALAWMTDYLRERADIVEQRPFMHVTQAGDTLHLTNVWAQFNPQAAQRILVTGHWDTRPVAEMEADPANRNRPIPGANDGGSSAAVILALADVLATESPAIGVDLLLTDGEDWGHDPVTFATFIPDMLLGARQFAANEGATYRPLFGILVDLVGEDGAEFPQEANSVQLAPEVVSRVWEAAADLGYGDVFSDRVGRPVTDDHILLNQAGIRTIDIIDFDYPFWHTLEDTPDKLSARTLQIVGDVLLEVIRRQGGVE